jgi:glutamate receptor, ionotropic, invertebrate
VATAGPELGLGNVGGVFVVLIGGMMGAFLVAVMEFLWNTRKIAVEERVSALVARKKYSLCARPYKP